MEPLSIDPKTVNLDRMIERGIKLHGHEGPFLIAGIRMGLLALELLDSPGYFGLEAESETGTTPPLSCLVDGIQVGSGCTLGKGNLRVTAASRPRARFSDTAGRRVTIELRADVCRNFLEGRSAERAAFAREAAAAELFLWEVATGP